MLCDAHAWHSFYAFLRLGRLNAGWTRDQIIEEINARGVPCFHGSASEVYLEGAFEGTGWRPRERLPVAKQLGETSLAFLVHPTLIDAEIGRTCAAIREVGALAQA